MPKLLPALSLGGVIWVLFLFFNAADLEYFGDKSDSAHVKIKCLSLSTMGDSPHDFNGGVTLDQSQALSAYIDDAQAADDQQDVEKLRTEAEQTIAGDCAAARLNRLALLIIVALTTSVLTTVLVLRPRPEPVAPATL